MYKIYTARRVVNDISKVNEIKNILNLKGIKYKVEDITSEILQSGFADTPIVKTDDGRLYNYLDALNIIK